MGFGRFGSSRGGSLEIISGMPAIINSLPERMMKNPLGPGSLAGVEVESVPETSED